MKIKTSMPLSRTRNFTARFWLAQAAAALALHGAQAQTPVTYTWNGAGTDNKWSNEENWSGGVAPSNPALPAPLPDIIVLSGTAQTSINVDAPWTINALVFGASADPFTLSGAPITLQPSNGTGHDSRYFVRNDTGKTHTINNDLIILPALAGENSKGSGVSVGTGTLIINGDIDASALKGTGIRFNGGTGTAIINGVISGNFGDTVAVNSNATAIFNSVNTYENNFAVWAGTAKTTVDALAGNVSGAFGKSNNAIQIGHQTLEASARLLASAGVTIGRDINMVANKVNAPYTIGGDTADVSNFTGTIFNGASSAPANRAIVTATAGGRSNITGIQRRNDASAGSSLADTLTKQGAGIVALTGQSNHSGQTNVNEGTLLVNGTIPSFSPNSPTVGDVVVESGATLGGSGYIYRNTIIQDGGIFSPGDIDASGTRLGGLLTVGLGLTFSENSLLQFDLGAPSSLFDDEVSVDGGQLTLDGILNVTPLAGFGIGTYKLFGYSGTLVNNGLSIGSIPAGFAASVNVDTANNAVYLNVVPEPGTGVLVFAAGALALFRRRRQA